MLISTKRKYNKGSRGISEAYVIDKFLRDRTAIDSRRDIHTAKSKYCPGNAKKVEEDNDDYISLSSFILAFFSR